MTTLYSLGKKKDISLSPVVKGLEFLFWEDRLPVVPALSTEGPTAAHQTQCTVGFPQPVVVGSGSLWLMC